jgi:hypothetical protein
MAERGTHDRDLRREEVIEIANEFASVHVCKVHTRNGQRLEIESRRRGRLIRLDPLELEALACHDDESFIDAAARIGRASQDAHPASTEQEER